jgi:DNA-directed RNA polymerase specialized sigma24 family protein
VDAQSREDFRSYAAGRSAALLCTAYLRTGNRADAEDLLQAALAKTCVSWDRIRDREAVDGYVCRVVVNTQTSWWRRRKVDERPTEELPDRGGGRDGTADLDLHDALWTAPGTLPRRQRAMVVLNQGTQAAVLVERARGAAGDRLLVLDENGDPERPIFRGTVDELLAASSS